MLALNPDQLREIGRKASYLHDLADKYYKSGSGVLSDSSILERNDESLLMKLTLVKGIVAWSVQMFSLHRKGVQLLYGQKVLPRPTEMEEICEKWKPYRSVGSWWMWRFMELEPKQRGHGSQSHRRWWMVSLINRIYCECDTISKIHREFILENLEHPCHK